MSPLNERQSERTKAQKRERRGFNRPFHLPARSFSNLRVLDFLICKTWTVIAVLWFMRITHEVCEVSGLVPGMWYLLCKCELFSPSLRAAEGQDHRSPYVMSQKQPQTKTTGPGNIPRIDN